jgi:hypothetical protein
MRHYLVAAKLLFVLEKPTHIVIFFFPVRLKCVSERRMAA